MSDEYRKTLDKRTGPGGVRCDCCNRYHGKDKGKLSRLVRRTLKEKTMKEIEEETGGNRLWINWSRPKDSKNPEQAEEIDYEQSESV